jgi:hypothetical protein
MMRSPRSKQRLPSIQAVPRWRISSAGLPIQVRVVHYNIAFARWSLPAAYVRWDEGRAARYFLAEDAGATDTARVGAETVIPLSSEGQAVLAYVRQPVAGRQPVGYERAFLDGYRPNESFYLSQAQREHLAGVGRPQLEAAVAGTYAKQILHRLLIDLAWNSSRLEGNTYSLLDTRRLLDFGEAAEGHHQREAQMILNDVMAWTAPAPA